MIRARLLSALAPTALRNGVARSAGPADTEDATTDESNLDYRSTVGREHDVIGAATVTLTREDAPLAGEPRTARAEELAIKQCLPASP